MRGAQRGHHKPEWSRGASKGKSAGVRARTQGTLMGRALSGPEAQAAGRGGALRIRGTLMGRALSGPEAQAAGRGGAPRTRGTLMNRVLSGPEAQAVGCSRAPGTQGADLGLLVPVQEPPLTSPCASCTSVPGDGYRSSGSSSPTSHSRCCCGGPMPWATPTTPTTWSSSEPGRGVPFGPQCEACTPHSGPETKPLSSCAQPGRQTRELGGLQGGPRRADEPQRTCAELRLEPRPPSPQPAMPWQSKQSPAVLLTRADGAALPVTGTGRLCCLPDAAGVTPPGPGCPREA